MIATRTFDYLDILKTQFPKDDIFAQCINGNWKKCSVDEYIEASWNVASALLAKGYSPEDKVVVVCNNRTEWNFLDMGCTLSRLIMVPVYQTLGLDEFLHVFNHSDSKLIVLGNKFLYEKLSPIIAKMDHEVEVMTIDKCNDLYNFDDLIELGKKNRNIFDPVIEKNKKEISPDDVATIIYTSGTTGLSKGLCLLPQSDL
jgi:long-chain acyl-CoA synthetase